MRKLDKDDRGFSMVEIIIVIAIISIMAGVTGFGFSLTNGKPAEECARKLGTAISHGRTTTFGKYRNIITVRNEDGKIKVTEDTLVNVKNDGSEEWAPQRSSMVGQGVVVYYKTKTGGGELKDGEAIQIWYDSGTGAMKEKYKKGKIDEIDPLTRELKTAEVVDYCTGFEISRASTTWYVELSEHTGRIALSKRTNP